MFSLLLSLAFFSLSLSGVRAWLPKKIFGVSLGSWLVLEPWMLPQQWEDMGGERCANCSMCIASEFAFTQAYPDTADRKFEEHWNTWFTQDDVDKLVELGINTVRIPLGYWIVEDLVDRATEFYPRGGLVQLRRGLRQLSEAGIVVMLDHHALPGVQMAGQMFTGHCTSDVQFYTPFNYHRALVWSAVMTVLSHVDPAFDHVVTIEAANQPLRNANLTPGYGDFQKNFVRVVRAVECLLGLPVPSLNLTGKSEPTVNVTASLRLAWQLPPLFSPEVRSAILDAVPILLGIALELGLKEILGPCPRVTQEPLITTFMDIHWQHNDPPNPADAAIGPQIYENHIYYSFGGVADANPTAYLVHNCNLDRIQRDAVRGNSPLLFGEWSLATQFPATDKFLFKWADAQKRSYAMGAGWIFWSFKIEKSDLANDLARQWSYFEGVKRGFLTKDPAQLNDPNVCDPYLRNKTASA
ncbi:putative glycosyl hydrolase 5 (cellulase A) family protein [Lyophyllum shimeji]|uniref:Glycosyl hydrolase 5 (Cellulase A) family protein n=1 Tax=Lyophyllum shimeji TaxID=47721 RepID=A0A9P3UQT8_LYOSH|nr:putative glycosyl hydrolase 5 (cellulase A) family protein [Lyophyllum shimeji]